MPPHPKNLFLMDGKYNTSFSGEANDFVLTAAPFCVIKEIMKKISKTGKNDLHGFLRKTLEMGAREAKIVDPKTVETAPWVRWKCRFGCGGYNSSLMCPPHSPPPEETRRVLNSYKWAILFESGGLDTKEIAAKMEKEVFLAGYYKALGLGAGPCRLCRSCAFEEGCRHPEEARPALEACGIDVFATARKHGFKIEVVKTYKAPQHYFGVLLIE
jgi:predicted metal-binding protein